MKSKYDRISEFVEFVELIKTRIRFRYMYAFNCVPLQSTWVYPRFLVVFAMFFFEVFGAEFLFFFALCLVCIILLVSLDYPFLIAPSVRG
jgi:hypothetical protein